MQKQQRAELVKNLVSEISDNMSQFPPSISIDVLLNVLVRIAGKSSIRIWRFGENIPNGFYIGSWNPPIISISSLLVHVYVKDGLKMADWKEQNENDHRRIVKTGSLDEAFKNFRLELLGPLPIVEEN